MNPINLIINDYERKARLYPAILVASPVLFAAVAAAAAKFSILQAAAGVVVSLGGTFLLSELARDAGKRKEPWLFNQWDGLPSVAIFRHRDERLDAVTKARYHKKMAALVKEAKAPTADQERGDPSAADAVYSAWSNYLRINSRDTKKFPMLFQENVSYGYRRNVWGMRFFGALLSLAAAAFCGVRAYMAHSSTQNLDELALCGLGYSVAILLLWLFKFTPSWVRIPADAYAARLTEVIESLGGRNVAPKQGAG